MNAVSRVSWACIALAAMGSAVAREPDSRSSTDSSPPGTTTSSPSTTTSSQGTTTRFDDTAYATTGGYAIQLDNDLFSLAHRDQDFSWGGGVTWASPYPGRLMSPLHAVRRFFDRLLVPDESNTRNWVPAQQATQVSLIAMTPETLRSAAPLYDDRPYASLLSLTSSEMRVLDDADRARFSSFTVGVLGLHVFETLHREVHKWVGNEKPLGWNYQISAGGEPTVRYTEAQQWLVNDPQSDRNGLPEVKLTLSGSLGFLTEADAALSMRWGRIQSPWWSFVPELGDYTSAPVAPVVSFTSDSPAEVFAFAGFRLKARAYNAFLQGQFRHSEVRVKGGDLSRLNAEGWIGLASTWNDLRLTYTIRYATAELKTEPGRRSLIWGSVNFEKSF